MSTTMKPFYNTRAKRNTAFIVLLVWLFALATGIANACLLDARQTTHVHIATAGFSEAAHAAMMLPGHAGAIDHGVGESRSKSLCLKVCDDGSRSFPKQNSTVDQTNGGPALIVQVLWRRAAPVIATLRHMDDEQTATLERPVRVRFSRLVI